MSKDSLKKISSDNQYVADAVFLMPDAIAVGAVPRKSKIRWRARLSQTAVTKPVVASALLHVRQSQRASMTAANIPTNCAAINAVTPAGAMPAKVSDNERATVTAGLANEVEAVNQ